MIEFFNKLFGRQPSGATAKERLRLVLMSDHLSLAPDMIEAMKRDLVDVISRYVEVDREKIDVHFEHQDKALAMLANIPITGVNRNGSSSTGSNGNDSNGEREPSAGNALATPQEAARVPEAMDGGTSGRARPATADAAAPKAKNGARRKRKKNGAAQSAGRPAPAT
ncbi:MAG: cell division topological specificity factor MinE [Candidatus Baltobacteraceae bacterium]